MLSQLTGFLMFIFIYFERERENIPSRLHAVSAEPNVGLEITNHEMMN